MVRTKTIRQSVEFEANPHEVYEILIDPVKHSELTGGTAEIVRKVGGRFNAFDSYISGKILELVPDRKIVASWRFEEEGWPKDHYSRATFLFGKTKNGTRLSFTHSGVPESSFEDVSKGWHEYYWTPMKEKLRKR